jgi:ElaB/YqjD/DUF883 family membrane-anchored ribosome-binding protein
VTKENTSGMSDETLNTAIKECIDRLNSLTAEENNRKNKKFETAKQKYEEAAKEFKEVADETNIPVVLSTVWKWRSQY